MRLENTAIRGAAQFVTSPNIMRVIKRMIIGLLAGG
jgi:hypothetical protein